jgi:hypothetical protein
MDFEMSKTRRTLGLRVAGSCEASEGDQKSINKKKKKEKKRKKK